ncbi:MAG: UDP-N-acetylmuramate dehydrogenase [Actinobacteria bacterium]|nr:UDP-N-acetylmuramate dehydrogenase [Actinomycetota bacterium]
MGKRKLNRIIRELSLKQSYTGCRTSTLTSMKTGGEATGLLTAGDSIQLLSIVKSLIRNEIKFMVIGGGTNIIFNDGKIDMALIKLGKGFDYVKFCPENIIKAGSAFRTDKLVVQAAKKGYDLSFLAGIPGTVGGLVMGNGGDKNTGICNYIKRLTYLSMDDGTGIDSLNISAREGLVEGRDYGYRYLNIPGLRILLEVDIWAGINDPGIILKKVRANISLRKKKQPAATANSGCIFKNPGSSKESAGRLIEMAGLKGFKFGGAMVSPGHANFIENFNGATSMDVVILSRIIKDRVLDLFGLNLDYEVRLIGF